MIRQKLLLIAFLFISTLSFSQRNETIFGFQFKPIVPNKFLGEYERSYDSLPTFTSSSKQKMGYVFGMLIRHNFTDKLAIETGINFTRRNYALHFEVPDSGYIADNTLGVINYQIPVSVMTFIQLSDEIYMNGSFGINFDFYPSDVRNENVVALNSYFLQEGRRLSLVQFGANANLGWEYRTRKKGTFYLGATYNQPFAPIMRFAMSWENEIKSIIVRDYIVGSYLTLDFRYYLPVDKN